MAKLCTTCGTALPTDDARFCSICGTLVASHPANARLSNNATGPSAPFSAMSGHNGQGEKPALREQIAQQPPARKDPPSWMGRLDTMPARKGFDGSQQKRIPDPSNAVWTGPPPQIRPAPAQDLQVKVWNAGEADDTNKVRQDNPNFQTEELVEELPTRPLRVPPPTSIPPSRNQAFPAPAQKRGSAAPYASEMEQLDTVPLATYVQTKHPTLAVHPSDVTQIPTAGLPEPYTPVAVQAPTKRAPQQAMGGGNPGVLRRKKRTSLWVVQLLGALLVLAGGLWVWFYHPFSVATVTEPQQLFSDGRLGFSLAYPTGWTAQTEPHTTTLHIYDSSHTAQVDVVVASSTTANGVVTQYLKQQAAHLGMTGAKTGPPLILGGASWQQIQGSIQQSGANYTAMLLATVHGNHLFTITQQAPQSIYADEEKAVFLGMRSSFQFVP